MLVDVWCVSECVSVGGCVVASVVHGYQVTYMSPMAFLQRPARWVEAISHFQLTHATGPNFAYDLCVRKLSGLQRPLDLSPARPGCEIRGPGGTRCPSPIV